MKTVFVIAGFDLHETATDKSFRPLLDGLRAKGYNVVPFDRGWYRKTLVQYVQEFETFYREHKTNDNVVLGNSFGAVTAFMLAPDLEPQAVYLASLSPFFKEDRHRYSDNYSINIFGKRRAQELWAQSSDEIATAIKIKGINVVAMYGEKEHHTSPVLVDRTKDTAKKSGAKLIEIPDAPHDMTDPVYTAAIIEML